MLWSPYLLPDVKVLTWIQCNIWQTHHLCQIKYQMKYNLEESPHTCFVCHPVSQRHSSSSLSHVQQNAPAASNFWPSNEIQTGMSQESNPIFKGVLRSPNCDYITICKLHKIILLSWLLLRPDFRLGQWQGNNEKVFVKSTSMMPPWILYRWEWL